LAGCVLEVSGMGMHRMECSLSASFRNHILERVSLLLVMLTWVSILSSHKLVTCGYYCGWHRCCWSWYCYCCYYSTISGMNV